MTNMEQQLAAIIRLATAQEDGERENARREVLSLLGSARAEAPVGDPERILRRVLLELGVPDHLRGHAYVVEAVLLIVEDRAYIHSVTFGLYPQVAAKYGTTASRVERAIRYLVEYLWEQGDWESLTRYFGGTVPASRGKPTNAAFLARLAAVVSQETRSAA